MGTTTVLREKLTDLLNGVTDNHVNLDYLEQANKSLSEKYAGHNTPVSLLLDELRAKDRDISNLQESLARIDKEMRHAQQENKRLHAKRLVLFNFKSPAMPYRDDWTGRL